MGTRWVWAVAVGLLGGAMFVADASAQDIVDPSNQQGGFSVHKADRSVADALEDFERYRDKRAWEKAFGALGKAMDGKLDGLVADKDGLWVSASYKIREELLTLSPEGRQAYRLFNDPKAQSLLDAAVNSAADSTGAKLAVDAPRPDSPQKLHEIVDRYFVTSAGDKAADRLGDALFEAGDFSGADAAWQQILDNYPDTSLSPALLETKCAIALARAGQWDKFAAAKALVHERYAGQTVHLGGRDVVATDYLDSLAADAPAAGHSAKQPQAEIASTITGAMPGETGDILPASDTPAWQVPLLPPAFARQSNLQSGSLGPPNTAADDRRLYVNWFGVYFAVDLNSGKLLWRSESFNNFAQKLNNQMRYPYGNPICGAVVPMGKNILFTGLDSNGAVGPQGQPLNRVYCLSAEDGKSVWASNRSALSDWNFVGSPILTPDGIYACAFPSANREMHLLCIAPNTGQLQWEANLGTSNAQNNPYGMPIASPPDLLQYRGIVYVLTNNGALLAVDSTLRRVTWAFKFDTPELPDQRRFFMNGEEVNPASATGPGAMLVDGSTLYFKELSSTRLFALDLNGPSLKWRRSIDNSVSLAGLVGNRLYLIGDEVDCIDVDSRALLWSDKLAPSTDTLRPLLTADRFFVFDQRGVHGVRLDTGDTDPIFRGYDRDGSGGILWQTHGRLVTVSAVAVTAYPAHPENTHGK